MFKSYLTILIMLIIGASCAVQQPSVKQEQAVSVEIPSGIDALTTMLADSIFSLVAVDEKDDAEAKSLFTEGKQIEGLVDSLWLAGKHGLFDQQDSLLAVEQLSRAQKYLQLDYENYKQTKKRMKRLGQLNAENLSQVSKQVMLAGIPFFENAIKKNRFNITYRHGLNQFFQKLAERLQNKNYLIMSAVELEKVVFFIKEYFQLYAELGEIYFKLNDWENSFNNYELAKNALRKTAIFYNKNPEDYFSRVTEVPIDTTLLVTFLSYQAICKTKLYETQPALALYREAKAITPVQELKERFEERIQWILWDDGNIRASEIKGKGDTLKIIDKNYLAAKNVYLDLLPILSTKRTRDETNWQIAQLDYANLGNEAEGVSRMYYVIKNSATDSLTGAALDSTYQRYFNTYGKMCFNLGSEYLQKDKLTAYIYFNQAAETNYNERGKALLQLAGISKFDPNETINLCKRTMEYISELNNNEKRILYQILYQTYRKIGDFQAARQWFERSKSF